MSQSTSSSSERNFEIARNVASGGTELIDNIPRLESIFLEIVPDLRSEGSWLWFVHRLMDVRKLPSYPQIRTALIESASTSQLQRTLTQLAVESNNITGTSFDCFDGPLGIWLITETLQLPNAVSTASVQTLADHFSKDESFERVSLLLARHFIRGKRPQLALPFLHEVVSRFPKSIWAYFNLARTQISAGLLAEALATLDQIADDCGDDCTYFSENAELLAEEGYLRGLALSLLCSLGESTDPEHVKRAYPRMSVEDEARSASTFAVLEYGCDVPEYWQGLAVAEGEDEVRCIDRSLDVAHLNLLLDLRDKAALAPKELRKILVGPVMDAAIQRQRLRTLRSLYEWAAERDLLSEVNWLLSDELLRHPGSCDPQSARTYHEALRVDFDVDQFRTALGVEACNIMRICGHNDARAKFLADLADNDSDHSIRAAARQSLAVMVDKDKA